MFNKNWWFLNFQKEFLNFSFCIHKLAVAFYMINEIQPKIKFQNIVQCPFKSLNVHKNAFCQKLHHLGGSKNFNSRQFWCTTDVLHLYPRRGHWPREWGMGMCSPEDPLFTPLLPLARVPFQAKESVHKTPFWENLEILASTASIFTQILAHKPPNLEIFSSQAPKFENFQLTSPKFGNFPLTSPPFQRQMSVRKPHTSEIWAAHPYLKKIWVPPPRVSTSTKFFILK